MECFVAAFAAGVAHEPAIDPDGAGVDRLGDAMGAAGSGKEVIEVIVSADPEPINFVAVALAHRAILFSDSN